MNGFDFHKVDEKEKCSQTCIDYHVEAKIHESITYLLNNQFYKRTTNRTGM